MSEQECEMVDSICGRTPDLRWTLELEGDDVETEDNTGHDDRVRRP
jgi:hypothetical protein